MGDMEESVALTLSEEDMQRHRQRLRTRFLTTLGKGMPDYELLELLLMTAIPRRDVKPLAKHLIQEFGSYEAVISADVARLMAFPGIGEGASVAIKTAQCAAIRLAQCKIMGRPVISNWRAVLDYCHSAMAHCPREQLRILFLNHKNVLIADELQQEGTVNETPVFTREVVRRALELYASSIILVHNHPSGDPTPSRADIAITKDIRAASEKLGIQVYDHLIIAQERHASFREMDIL